MCFIRIFCKEIKAVSELEKKAESITHTRARIKYSVFVLSMVAS